MRGIILRAGTVLFGTASYVLIGMAIAAAGLKHDPEYAEVAWLGAGAWGGVWLKLSAGFTHSMGQIC